MKRKSISSSPIQYTIPPAPIDNTSNFIRRTGSPSITGLGVKVARSVLQGNISADKQPIYFQKYNSDTNALVFDSNGIPLLDCCRGTNDVENCHKQLHAAFHGWPIGVALSDALLSEWRHRYNHNASERRRLGFPKLCHYDTWLIDSIQILVEETRNRLIYPGWSNTADYKPTPERFGTVAIHSPELHAAVMEIDVPNDISLTGDKKYIAESMGVPLPFLPVYGKDEKSLFNRFMVDQGGTPDYGDMAIKWCANVNCTTIWPKLPAYLSSYHTTWLRNQRVQQAIKTAKTGEEALARINSQTEKLLEEAIIDKSINFAKQTMEQHSQMPKNPLLDRNLTSVAGGTPGGVEPTSVPAKKKMGRKPNSAKPGAKKTRRTCKQCDDVKCKGSQNRTFCSEYGKNDGGSGGSKWDVVEGGHGNNNLEDAPGDIGLVQMEYNAEGQPTGHVATL